MAFTNRYFIIDEVESVSIEVKIRKCDLINPESNFKINQLSNEIQLK